jgi:hypothetical protein
MQREIWGPVLVQSVQHRARYSVNACTQYSAFTYGVPIKYVNLGSPLYYKLEVNRLSPDVWVQYLPNFITLYINGMRLACINILPFMFDNLYSTQ